MLLEIAPLRKAIDRRTTLARGLKTGSACPSDSPVITRMGDAFSPGHGMDGISNHANFKELVGALAYSC